MAPIQEDDSSLLYTERISQYVSLSPACLATPLPALCASIFSPLLLSYFPPARGVVLAYEDVQLSASPPAAASSKPRSKSGSTAALSPTPADEAPLLLLRHVDEYSAPFLWATASFLVWRPRKNVNITARVTHQSGTHITLSHLNTFPVSVLAEHLPTAWEWHSETLGKMKKGWDGRVADEGGWWMDGEGERVDGGRELEIRIRDFDGRLDGKGRGKGFLRIEGSLLSVEEEKTKVVRGAKGKAKATTGVLRTTSRDVMEID